MKVYVAGPMRHYPYWNFPAFEKAAELLRSQGHEVISPAEMELESGNTPYGLPLEHDWSHFDAGQLPDIIKRDLEAVRDCDALYMLEGWDRSVGAQAEYCVAKWYGKHIMFEAL